MREMPSLGFGDEEKKELTEEQIEARSEEIKKNLNMQPEQEQFKFSKRKLEQLRAMYSHSYVHDYGDGYHKSEEDLKAQNALYDVYRKIAGKKQSYRKIDEFIVAYRNCLDFVKAVARGQKVYSYEEYLHLWSKGKIRINGMYTPKYKGKDRKRISWKALGEYILSDDDPKGFIIDTAVHDITTKEELDKAREELFTVDEYKKIMYNALHMDEDEYEDTEEIMVDEDVPESYEKKPIATYLSKEEQKDLLSGTPGLTQLVREVVAQGEKADRRAHGYVNELAYQFDTDDLSTIEKYNRAYGVETMTDLPVFKGSLMSKKDCKSYLRALEEWNFKNTKIKVDGRYRTLEEENEIRAKEVLDKNGMNVRMFWTNSRQDEKIDKWLKKSRQKEKELRKQLSRLDEINGKGEKNEKNRGLSDAEKYRKYKELEKKDKAKKKKKKAKKGELIVKHAAKQKQKRIDNAILGSVGKGSYQEYAKEALDFTSSSMQKDMKEGF